MKSSKTNSSAAPYTIAAHLEAHSGAHQAHTESTPKDQEAHTSGAHPDDRTGKHTAKELSERFGIAGSTLRTRWYRWLSEAVGEPRLKVDGKFTDLAAHLFGRYKSEVAEVEGASGDDWASRIAQEYPPVIEAELEPEPEPAGALQLHSSSLALQVDAGLERQAEELDQLDQAIALAEQMLKGDIALLQEKAEERNMLTEAQQAGLQRLRDLQIERDELQRIENERQQKEREEQIRRSVRERVLGKSSGQL